MTGRRAAAGKHRKASADRLERDEEGAVAVEYALVALTILPILFAIILPLGHLYSVRLDLERSVGQAARWGAISGNVSRTYGPSSTLTTGPSAGEATGDDIIKYANLYAPPSGATVLSTTVTCVSIRKNALYSTDTPCSTVATTFSTACPSKTSLTVTQMIQTDYGPVGEALAAAGLAQKKFVITAQSTVCKE